MHESSLARSILSFVLEAAKKEGATQVKRVHGWVAETESISRESLEFQFAALSRHTVAEGAVLDLAIRWVEARCHKCKTVYRPEHHILLCPACGGTEADLLSETGLGIERIELGGLT